MASVIISKTSKILTFQVFIHVDIKYYLYVSFFQNTKSGDLQSYAASGKRSKNM